MSTESLYLIAANTLLVVHALFAAFVVLGLFAIYLGHFVGWAWVKNMWFRAMHLAGIIIVVLQAWAGLICPLTTWEMALRERAGVASYSGSFIQHWLQSLLYYSAPEWVFIVVYTLFGGLVVLSWFVVKPRWGSRP